jgi:hypothetical protein
MGRDLLLSQITKTEFLNDRRNTYKDVVAPQSYLFWAMTSSNYFLYLKRTINLKSASRTAVIKAGSGQFPCREESLYSGHGVRLMSAKLTWLTYLAFELLLLIDEASFSRICRLLCGSTPQWRRIG